ncbi:MAG: membrane lipoprotein lipid attachment site-containing protein, partial [Paludibacteraceae bacterium]|nr:membrane lipoprotein lipid attachment site-containing protein [Paludibacteraceae bacterium]
MKKFFFMAGLVLLVAACSKESENMVNNAQTEKATAPVMVRVSGFSVSQEAFETPRRAAQDVADYTDVKAIDLAFYSGETEVYKTTQVRGQGGYTTFGEFSCNLPVGSYTMVVVGRGWYDGDVFTLTSP